MSKLTEDTLMHFWAKADAGTGLVHPLLCHLVDTSCVARVLWQVVIGSSTRRVFSSSLAISEQSAGAWLTYLAGLHDIGKVTPGFQGKFNPRKEVLEHMRYGFPIGISVAHGTAGIRPVCSWLRERFQNCLGARAINMIAYAICGHHGLFASAADIPGDNSAEYGGDLWIDARTAVLQTYTELIGPNPETLEYIEDLPVPASVLLAAITSVADWIASSAENFPINHHQLH